MDQTSASRESARAFATRIRSTLSFEEAVAAVEAWNDAAVVAARAEADLARADADQLRAALGARDPTSSERHQPPEANWDDDSTVEVTIQVRCEDAEAAVKGGG